MVQGPGMAKDHQTQEVVSHKTRLGHGGFYSNCWTMASGLHFVATYIECHDHLKQGDRDTSFRSTDLKLKHGCQTEMISKFIEQQKITASNHIV